MAGINNILNLFTGVTTIIGGVISNTTNTTVNSRALTKTGGGTLILTGANTYNALTNILQGAVIVQNGSAFGGSPLQPSLNGTSNTATTPAGNASSTMGVGSVLVASGALLQLLGGATVNDPLVLSGGTVESVNGNNAIGGNIFLAAPSTILVDTGTLSVTGTIAGYTDWTKSGGGTLALDSAGYNTGQDNINGGIVQLGNPEPPR